MTERAHYYKWDTLYLRCPSCGKFKQCDGFYKDKNSKIGLSCYCKECNKARASALYDSKRDKTKPRETRKRFHYYKNWELYLRCGLCKGEKPAREFSRNTTKALWYSYECRECSKHKELGFNVGYFRSKETAYVKKHNLRPNECMICGAKWKIDFHHPSYENISKRKEWIFVCRYCHQAIHLWQIECPEPLDLIQFNAHMPTILTDKDLENVAKNSIST